MGSKVILCAFVRTYMLTHARVSRFSQSVNHNTSPGFFQSLLLDPSTASSAVMSVYLETTPSASILNWPPGFRVQLPSESVLSIIFLFISSLMQVQGHWPPDLLFSGMLSFVVSRLPLGYRSHMFHCQSNQLLGHSSILLRDEVNGVGNHLQ